MIQVNLLPEEMRKIERMRKVKVNVALLVGAAAAAAAVVIGVILFVVGRRMRDLAEVRKRLREITPQREEAEAAIKKKQELGRELGALDAFSDRRLLWGRTLNAISDAMPRELFLGRIGYSSKPPVLLTIKGEAVPGAGNEKVVEFIESLRRTPIFIDAFPHLDYAIESLDQGRRSFEIKCTPPGSSQPDKAKRK